MKFIDEAILVFEENLLKVLFLALPALCALQVLSRFVLHIPVPWSEEVMRVLFIWATFLGASLAVKQGAHLSVRALVQVMPRPVGVAVTFAVDMACGVLCLYFAWAGFEVSLMEAQSEQVLPVLGLPTYLSSAALPVGFLLMGVRFLIAGIARFTTRAA
jgi:TRAP-type C4-dicarboxylate transport system permease small subunit